MAEYLKIKILEKDFNKLVDERLAVALAERGPSPRLTLVERNKIKDEITAELSQKYQVLEELEDTPQAITKFIRDTGAVQGWWDKDLPVTSPQLLRDPRAGGLRNDIREAGGLNAYISRKAEDYELSVVEPIADTSTDSANDIVTTPKDTVTSEQKNGITTTTADDPLITEIFTTFYSPDWQSRIGDITNKIMASMKYSETPDPSTGEKVLTADSLRRYNIYHSQLEAAQKREADARQQRADKFATEYGGDLQRHLGDQRYRQAMLTKILDDPFKYRAATGQGMYLDPQNLGDYDRMDPFRKGQYGADLGLIGETPKSIGRMVTPAGFAERSAPMLTSLPSWRRLD